VGAYGADDPDGKSHQGKSYVVFGKKDNTNAIELRLCQRQCLTIQWHRCCLFCQIQHMIYLHVIYRLDRLA
jgi:hypothetical protein